MKELCFNKKGVNYTPLKYWTTDKDTKVAIYQGSRGDNPELDFIVKYKETNKRLRTPSHTHWITDLLVKCEHNKELVGAFVKKVLSLYETTEPFNNTVERNSYELNFYKNHLYEFDVLENHGYYKMDTLVSFIELFTICEKQTKDAYMFKTLLTLVLEYCEGKKDFYQIVSYSKRV
jgi:hypothetical protein